jgi:hypothetical protein
MVASEMTRDWQRYNEIARCAAISVLICERVQMINNHRDFRSNIDSPWLTYISGTHRVDFGECGIAHAPHKHHLYSVDYCRDQELGDRRLVQSFGLTGALTHFAQ